MTRYNKYHESLNICCCDDGDNPSSQNIETLIKQESNSIKNVINEKSIELNNNLINEINNLKNTNNELYNNLNANIISYIDNLYNIYPKVTGTGTNILLNNTRYAKMNVIGDDNTNIKIIGKNLYKTGNSSTSNGITYTYNEDGSVNITGTSTAQANKFITIPLESSGIVSGKTYTLSSNQDLPAGALFMVEEYKYEENKTTWLSRLINITNSTKTQTKTFNLSNECTHIRFTLRINPNYSVDINNLIMQLEEDNTNTSIERYREQNITLPNDNIYSYDTKTYIISNNSISASALMKGDE